MSQQFIPLSDLVPRPAPLRSWERVRVSQPVNWVIELIAEATGTFIYTYAGAGATAAYVLGNILKVEGLSNVFQIGLAYAVGIALALIICWSLTDWLNAQPTSAGYFSPGYIIHAMIFKGFNPWKGLRYIIAEIFGAYIACLLVYVQYKVLIHEAVDALIAANLYDALMFTPSGPGGIFGLYVSPGSDLTQVLLNEFVCDFVLGLAVFSLTDLSNPITTPSMMPWAIALSYAVFIWGFSPVGLAANAARDVGGRLAALTLFGRGAAGGSYAALAALTNIPATLLAGAFYELVLADSARVVHDGVRWRMGESERESVGSVEKASVERA
ncbi:aquaporin-like protein [Epithele typhae]|uniref:aquaporin-like protein n=1 Tax=Epithele typhae TaxID=378194 RepID=UPI002008C338|nr:aquaporin-like protein [Epithele typhae]KAH9917896.1 aquaporin-like protein [Epithele typhae]